MAVGNLSLVVRQEGGPGGANVPPAHILRHALVCSGNFVFIVVSTNVIIFHVVTQFVNGIQST